MIIPHQQKGLQASLPQAAGPPVVADPPKTIYRRLASDGSVWIDQSAVKLGDLRVSLERILGWRADRVAFFQGDGSLELKRLPGFGSDERRRRFACRPRDSELEKNR